MAEGGTVTSAPLSMLRDVMRRPPPPSAGRPFYADDMIEVYTGDWRDVLPPRLAELGLGADDVALVHADPPYGTGEHHDRARRGRGQEAGGERGRLVGGRGRPRPRDWPDTAGNDVPFDPSDLLVYPKLITWGANHYAARLPDAPAWLVWDKREGTGSDHGSDAELAWRSFGRGVRVFSHLWRGVCRRSETGRAHLGPTQKPIALVEWAFGLAKLRPGDLVLVPFLGTGPELVVCRTMGLRCLAADISPYWCEVAVRERLAKPDSAARGLRSKSAPAMRARPVRAVHAETGWI